MVQLRADLASTSMPEVLHSVHELAAAGTLELRRGEVVKRLLVREARIVYAASTDRQDWLASFLHRRGRLDAEQLEAIGERHRFSKRVGVLLVERGLLSPREVYSGIQEQLDAIVDSVLPWDEGEATFRVAPLEGIGQRIQIHRPLARAVVDAARVAPDVKRLAGRLGRDTVLAPAFRSEQLIEVELDAEEHRLLRSVDGHRTVYELCSLGGSLAAAECARLLFAYHVLELVRTPGAEGRRDGPIKIRLSTGGDRF